MIYEIPILSPQRELPHLPNLDDGTDNLLDMLGIDGEDLIGWDLCVKDENGVEHTLVDEDTKWEKI